VRLFVAVWPPQRVVAMLGAIERPPLPPLRWTTRPQWHVTLRFLGEVDDPGPVGQALRAVPAALRAGGEAEVRAELGPATAWFSGRQVLQIPVTGLDALAKAVADRTAPWERQAEDRPFSGHLTVARTRGRARGPASVAGTPLAAAWRVEAFELVASVLGRGGTRYETLDAVSLLDDDTGA